MRRGSARARVHHIGCVADQCGVLEQVRGWTTLAPDVQSVARAALNDTMAAGAAPAPHADAEMQGAAARAEAEHVPRMSDASIGTDLRHMDFWSNVSWDSLHDPVITLTVVPEAVKPAIADLRKALSDAASAVAGTHAETIFIKALLFSDRLLFSSVRKRRGGQRGQKGETVARTIARRLRLAWEGAWSTLWQESGKSVQEGRGAKLTSAERLAHDVRSISQALAEDDIREALRVADGPMQMATDAKARSCLPALFPRAAAQPPIVVSSPAAEDVEGFLEQLYKAYRHSPKHRGAGPGGSRAEHWFWMPEYEDSWKSFAQLSLRLQLGMVAQEVLQPWMSARVLAGDRDEADKVRPFALGNFHPTSDSKAVGRLFKSRVAAALQDSEYSVGNSRGAECMHKTALLDFDARGHCCKLSLDVSNAHNEYDRTAAAASVRESVPDFLPWARVALCTATVHVHVGTDGVRTALPKERGGDQGDALTNYIFPLTYKRVTASVRDAAQLGTDEARDYSYQDDLDIVCAMEAVPAATAAFTRSCAEVGLRPNLLKTNYTPGRRVDLASLPNGVAGVKL